MNQVKMHSDDELRVAKLNKSIDKLESVIQDYKDEIEQIQRKLKWTTFDLENQIEERDKIVNIYLRAQPFRSFKGMSFEQQMDYSSEIRKAHGIKNVIYSCYEFDYDEIAVNGKCTLKHWGWDDENYSEEFHNPTWFEVMKFADVAIEKVQDGHHIFLEGIYRDGNDSTGTTYLLSMGS